MSNKNQERRLLSQDLKEKDWIGKVIDSDDPIRQFRCKVKVFGLYDELATDHIPWAFPGNSSVFSSKSGGFGSGSVPKNGTLVKIKFNNGDIYSPEYYAIQNANDALKSLVDDDYLGTHVIAYDEDEDLQIIYQKGKGIRIHLKGSHVTINRNESITIEHSSSESIIELEGNKINIVSTSEVNLTTENCNVDSPNIKLGDNATQSLIKGDLFKKIYDTHTHPSSGAPPTIPLPAGVLSKNTKTK